jgi:serine/threonine protein kinase/tetratricopeptide (TPR) repeat protein
MRKLDETSTAAAGNDCGVKLDFSGILKCWHVIEPFCFVHCKGSSEVERKNQPYLTLVNDKLDACFFARHNCLTIGYFDYPMELVTCPTPKEILELLKGELVGGSAASLREHLQSCSHCVETVRKLAQGQDSDSQSSKESLSEGGKTVVASSPLHSKLGFLSPPEDAGELGRMAHYRVLKVLGEGGMGMVLLAEDTLLLRQVALKVIKPEYKDDESSHQRFLREARSMAKLKSEHVVMVHEVGQQNGMPFIAMELLEGIPLSDLLDDQSRPPIREILRIAREIATALAAAHAHGVIHRDIKPENIWLEKPNGRIKLLDFGLARPHHVNTKLTSSGQIIGTPFYMSPEQARGGEIDERTDLFSLGCLLYELLTGKPPFGRPTLMDTILALAVETPAEPSALNPLCSPLLDGVILRLLAKSAGDRIESAQMLIAQLEAIEKSLPSSHGEVAAAGSRTEALSYFQRGKDKIKQSGSGVGISDSGGQRHSSSRKSERRQVTVLVCGCELFESDQYLESLSTEQQSTVLQAFEQFCRQTVIKAEGTPVECTVENFIGCFGYPLAQEDAPQLAANAAIALLDSLMKLSSELNTAINPWIAIHTGFAIASTEDSVVALAGEARNVATRLKNVASAGRIVLSDSTHKMLRGQFACTSLGNHQIKGVQDQIELFELQVRASSSGVLEVSGPIELSPLTGRDQEVSLLKDRWEKAQEGMGQVVLLIGEAGLGKSRLVHAMKEHVLSTAAASAPSRIGKTAVQDPPVIEWRCSQHFRDTGLYPASSFFQRLLNFQRDEEASVQFDRLVKHLDFYSLGAKEMVPIFASLLSLPANDKFPSLSLTPAREREELFQALKDWLQAYSSRQPVLFILEDLHWLDASTLDFLGQLLAEGLHDRILILLTFRPEFRTPWPALAHQTSLALNRLTRRQVSEMMRKKAGGDVSESAVEQIYDRSGGVPLFVEEFTRMAQETGALTQTPNPGDKSLLSRAIPATLQDLIMARLDRMEGDRDLAQMASAIGREFSFELLAAVSNADERLLPLELEKLVKAEILFQKGRAPHSTYVFKHALFEDSLYNAMVKSERQKHHAKIAEVLESQTSETMQTRPEVIAHHFAEAGLTDKAIGYLVKAGLKSQEQFANVEAISHFKKGLELVALLPESPERDMQELALLVPLASAYQMVLGYAAPDVEPTLARARELNERIGKKDQLFAIMWVSWTWHLVNSNLDLCLQLAEEMVALADEVGDRGMLMEAYVAPAVTLYYRGDFAGCRTLCQKAIDEFEDLEQCRIWSVVLGQNSAIVLRCYLSMALFHLGYADQALKLITETLAMANRAGQPFSRAHALYFASWLYLNCRMFAEMEITAEDELAVANDQGFALWQATGTFHIGAAMIDEGELIAGVEHLENGIKMFKRISASLTLPAQLAVLADGYIKAGRLKEAQAALDESQERLEKTSNSVYAAEIFRLRGVIALALSNDESAASNFFQDAIKSSSEHNSKAWELRASLSLAKLLQKQGRISQAREALQSILSSFTEGKSLSDFQEAAELMPHLEG